MLRRLYCMESMHWAPRPQNHRNTWKHCTTFRKCWKTEVFFFFRYWNKNAVIVVVEQKCVLVFAKEDGSWLPCLLFIALPHLVQDWHSSRGSKQVADAPQAWHWKNHRVWATCAKKTKNKRSHMVYSNQIQDREHYKSEELMSFSAPYVVHGITPAFAFTGCRTEHIYPEKKSHKNEQSPGSVYMIGVQANPLNEPIPAWTSHARTFPLYLDRRKTLVELFCWVVVLARWTWDWNQPFHMPCRRFTGEGSAILQRDFFCSNIRLN